MERDNVVQKKSFDFAVKAIKLSYKIQKQHKEFDLSRQLIRSSSSIGAIIEESMGGQSDKDFLHKVSISYKEARESAIETARSANDSLSKDRKQPTLEEAKINANFAIDNFIALLRFSLRNHKSADNA